MDGGPRNGPQGQLYRYFSWFCLKHIIFTINLNKYPYLLDQVLNSFLKYCQVNIISKVNEYNENRPNTYKTQSYRVCNIIF